jgi:hypothetical protein
MGHWRTAAGHIRSLKSSSPPNYKYAVNSKIIRRLIVAAIVLEFLWLIYLPAGNRLSPRSPEMAQALRAFETNRSPATEAEMWEQVRRDDSRDWRRKEILFGLMLLADAVVIYFYWNYGTNKTQKRAEAD